MTQHYVSTKIVTAWAQDRQDIPGYAVKYEDGYISWSPAPQFEAATVALGQVGHLPLHEQRVVAEHAQLNDRLIKLRAFLTTPLFESLPPHIRQLRLVQAEAMSIYLDSLSEIMAEFGGAK